MVTPLTKQQIDLDAHRPPEVSEAKHFLNQPKTKRCGRPTKTTGCPCKDTIWPSSPACRHHLTPDESAEEARALRHAREVYERYQAWYWDQIKPWCWMLPITDEDRARVAAADDSMRELLEWQQRRCAICGCKSGREGGERLTIDHDHETGLSRGYLCDSCNWNEGGCRPPYDDPFAKYRRQNPASMLGVEDVYQGPWWDPRDATNPAPVVRAWVERTYPGFEWRTDDDRRRAMRDTSNQLAQMFTPAEKEG